MGTRRNILIAEQHPTGLTAPVVCEQLWARIYKIEAHKKQDGRCAYCREPIPSKHATADHVHPRARGGATSRKNIKSACEPCNKTKGTMTEKKFKQLIRCPPETASIYVRLAHIRWRLWTREALAEKRILGVVGL